MKMSCSSMPSFLLWTAAAVVSAAWLVRKSREKRTRRAKYTCSCGKVDADIVIPAENYRYMEIPSFQCCCNDCVGFCEKVLQHGNVEGFLSPAAKNLVMYNTEIVFKSGEEHLKCMKLSEKTGNIRIYCTCCATPICIAIEGAGASLIYTNNLSKDGEISNNSASTEVPLPDLEPMVCFFHPTPLEGVKTVPGQFAPKTIAYCIGRMALLAVLGKKGPGKGFPIENVDVGEKSIQDAFKAKRK